MTEHQDFIATELLSELKAENVRKDSIIHKLQKDIIVTIICAFVSILCVIAGFLFYLNQYDFSSVTTATGVYALVDSNGNVVAHDLTFDEIYKIVGELNNGESDENTVED